MERPLDMPKQRGVDTDVLVNWLCRLFIPAMLMLLTWTLSIRKFDFVKYEILLGAILFGMLISLRFRLEQGKNSRESDYEQMLHNVNEAQKILGQKISSRWFGLLENSSQSNTSTRIYFDRKKFIDFLKSPVFLLTCFSISLLIQLSSLSIEMSAYTFENGKLWIDFLLIYSVQFLFLSLFF